MAREQQQPWWERPARSPNEPEYVREREHFRAELARAWRADDASSDWRRARLQFDSRYRSTAA